MTILDTHVLVWWLDDPERLTEPARSQVDAAMHENSLGVSAITAWEIAMLVKKGRLILRLHVDDYISHCESLPFLQFLPLTPSIAFKSVELDPFHGDPADRIIVATTLRHNGTLVTKDERIQKFDEVTTIW